MPQWTTLIAPLELVSVIEAHELPGVREIRSDGESLRVGFADSDFLIRLAKSKRQALWEATWEVTVREPGPGLGTWWGRWSHSFAASPRDLGASLAGQIGEVGSRIRRMLDDHLSKDMRSDVHNAGRPGGRDSRNGDDSHDATFNSQGSFRVRSGIHAT